MNFNTSYYKFLKNLTAINGSLINKSEAILEPLMGAIDGTNKTYNVTHTPQTQNIIIFWSGVKANEGSDADFTINGTTITFIEAPTIGDTLFAFYSKTTN